MYVHITHRPLELSPTPGLLRQETRSKQLVEEQEVITFTKVLTRTPYSVPRGQDATDVKNFHDRTVTSAWVSPDRPR